jgi:hypothetical protein
MAKRKMYRTAQFNEQMIALQPSSKETLEIEQTCDLLVDNPRWDKAYPVYFPYKGVWCCPVGRFNVYYIFDSYEWTAINIEA